jgi:hypothetical protein
LTKRVTGRANTIAKCEIRTESAIEKIVKEASVNAAKRDGKVVEIVRHLGREEEKSIHAQSLRLARGAGFRAANEFLICPAEEHG